MNKYNEYFDIDEGYWPEINPSSIKDPLNRWEKTFPHKTFIDLLKATERMLARGANNDKKGIWLEGAYGTGKSRVAWTLRNLLDCPDDALKAYFEEYPALQSEPDLRDKLLGHKQGKIITAYRYASGSIDNDRALIMAVYESVSQALRKAGVAYKGEDTLRGGVAAWLSNDANKAYFDSLIAEPEYRGLGSFAGKSTDDIISLLENPGADVRALMGDIFSLADSRGITALSTNMDDLINWLTDIIDQNGLKAIVLVWDEFSSYFKKNRTSLDEFQKLAELSNDKPFYLMIVTHMSGSIFNEADQTGKIVRDRFVRKEIELPDSIAFELIQHALKVKAHQKELWETLADDLNSRMPFVREAVRKAVWKDTNHGEDVLKGMLPLHPLAALLLKNISSAFASNQRSMFNYIKNAETENLQAFQWFIDTHSPDDADILSIDFLWNFFYEAGTDDYGTGTGRSNLDSIIRTTLDTFPKNESRLNTEQSRILKTVLMMQAISQKLGDSVELFLPTEQNINHAFEGTEFENNRAVNVVKNQLVKEGILYAKPMGNGKVQYAAAAVSGDQAQIDNIKKRLETDTKTVALVSDGELVSALSLTPPLRFRYEVTPVTIENFTATINKITNEQSTYKLRAVLSFARDDEERNRVRQLIKSAVKDEHYRGLVFVDVSSSVMGGDRFEQWVDCAANEEYWRSKDGKLADEMSRKAKNILEGWKVDVANGTFTVYSDYAKTGEPYSSASLALNALSDTVIRKYPLSFDNAKVSENFFLVSGLPSGTKYGISETYGGIFQQKSVDIVMQGAWQVDKYWESNPTLPLSKLKLKVDKLIKAAFEGEERRIAVGDIFDALMEQGFMPCNLYALLTGFLLKEYAVDTYRYSDGETGDKMSVEKLAEIIGEYIKLKNTPNNRYKEKFIAVMSKEQIAFSEFANVVFGIPDNLPIEQIAVRIRSKLKELKYPIWCFKEIDTNGLDDFINRLAALSNSDGGESVAKIADDIGRMSLQIPTAAKNLNSLLTEPNAKKAISEFLDVFENGDILRLAKEINAPDVLLDVRRKVGAGEALWLWDQKTGEDELRKLLIDYKIVVASNRINSKASSLSDCFSAWGDKAKSLRTPCSALVQEIPTLKAILGCLQVITTTGDLAYDKRSNFLSELESNGQELADLFSNNISVFKEIYSFHLTDFSDSDVGILYSKLPVTSFSSGKSDFERIVVDEAQGIRKEQAKYKLHELWQEKTSSRTPRDWSTDHKTPILSLVPRSLHSDARRAFGAIHRKNPEDGEVQFALEFIQQKATFLADLNDKSKVEAAFARDILGRFITVLPDADMVRSRLESVVTGLPYDWYGDPAVQREVEKFAQAKYSQGGSDKALAQIEEMDAEKVKEYLKRLVKDNMNVGIEIISEGGSKV